MLSRISFVLSGVVAAPTPAPTPAPNSVPQWGLCADNAQCGAGLVCTSEQCVPDSSRTCSLQYETCTDTSSCCVLNNQVGANQAICVGNSWKSCSVKGSVPAGGQCFQNDQCIQEAASMYCGNDGKCGPVEATPAPTPAPSTVKQYGACGANDQCMEGLTCSGGFCAADPSASCKLQFQQCTADADCCQQSAYGCYGSVWWKSCQANNVVPEGGQCFADAQCADAAPNCNAGKCSTTAGTPAPTPAAGSVPIYGACADSTVCMQGTTCTNAQCVSTSSTTCKYPWNACTASAECCGNMSSLYGCFGNQWWKACYQHQVVKVGQFCYDTLQCVSGSTCVSNKCTATR